MLYKLNFKGLSECIISKNRCIHFKTNPKKRILSRTGLVAIKKGMLTIWNSEGKHVPVTVLAFDGVQAIGQRTEDKNGYSVVLIGSGWKTNARKTLSRADLGQFSAANVPPKKKVVEFRVNSKKGLIPVGTIFTPNWFKVGQKVDVRAVSRGKGFAGVMSRWNFSGMPAKHGASLVHRHAGSIGQCQDPGRVIPGKKMAGRIGGQRVTTQGLEVVKVDLDFNLILIKGAVPGPEEGHVIIQDSIKTRIPFKSQS